MNFENPKIEQVHKENKSKLSIKSIGYAAVNLPLDTNALEVYPAEEYGYADGEITDEREQLEEGGVDAKGNVYQDVVDTSNTILAEWMQWGTHRHKAPNIRRGERVLLWQFSDEDKYYWTSMGMDDHLRRRETAIFKFSNTRDESVTSLTSENSYSFIVSTHTKEVTLQTTKTDGEKFEYIVKLDTENNLFVVTDDAGNQITLESDKKRISMVNSTGSSVIVDDKDINITAVGSLNINAKSVNITSATHNVTADKYGMSAKSSDIDAGSFGLKGGVMDLQGSSLIVGKDATFKGGMFNNGVNVGSSHTHSGVKRSNENTNGPQ